jgi:hypothetical protein
MLTPDDNEVTIKKCSEPNEQVKEIYQAAGVNELPLKPRNPYGTKSIIKKINP